MNRKIIIILLRHFSMTINMTYAQLLLYKYYIISNCTILIFNAVRIIAQVVIYYVHAHTWYEHPYILTHTICNGSSIGVRKDVTFFFLFENQLFYSHIFCTPSVRQNEWVIVDTHVCYEYISTRILFINTLVIMRNLILMQVCVCVICIPTHTQ